MDKNQGKNSAGGAKGKATAGAGKGTSDKKAASHGDKGGAVLAAINGDAKKTTKSTKKETK